jgi:peptidoglycan/xylan/chitin deacetylase (PgdA/CDA1 family)
MIRISITMCHGLTEPGGQAEFPLTADHFDQLIRIAHDMGLTSINYDELDAWRNKVGSLPERPIMFDFDHPAKSMRHGVHDILERYGYSGNLFINTGWFDPDRDNYAGCMTWDEVRELVDLGWHIGAHTVTHPNLSELAAKDPDGEKLHWELETCDTTLVEQLGIVPKDFAFTGTSWSSEAEKQVSARYRFGRFWIIGSHYRADGEDVRLADLLGVEGADKADGGPPMASRYITGESHPHRLPSIEIQRDLIYRPEAFRAYLEGALANS